MRFTTLVDAPLTVAFDVAHELGPPWPFPLREVDSRRPHHDVHAARRLTHVRRFTPTAAGTLVEEQVDWTVRLPGALVHRALLRRRLRIAMRAYLAAYAAAVTARARDVVQVVGAAVVRGDRLLVAQRSGGAFDGQWEFPGGKVEPGESDLDALVRECREELGVTIAPTGFLGEVVLPGVVGGGAPGASTLRVWAARLPAGEPVAREHATLAWARADELDALDWIAADRPLLPAARSLLRR